MPDKFKGSATAAEVASSLEVAIRKIFIGRDRLHIETLPLADGGDGSTEVLLTALCGDAQIVDVETFDPLMRPIKAPMLIFERERVKYAFIEMAKCCGLTLLHRSEYNPERTTTYGLGVMIQKAAGMGATKIMMGIGGSATNDGGAGMLEAGIPQGITVQVACDVENPLLGPNGATMIYAPQKGADGAMLERLERRMECFAEQAEAKLREKGDEQRAANYRSIPGGGAAGGVGAALYGFYGAELVPGWRLFGDMFSLEEKIAKADAVITGEGRFDSQSLSGKLVGGVSQLCRKYKKRLTVVCGESALNEAVWHKHRISDVYALSEIEPDKEVSIRDAKMLLKGIKGRSQLLYAGCDEAGRGSLAGPVFAAAVILPEGFCHPLLNDSKQLSEQQRDELRPIIEREALAWSVAAVPAEEIDRINILNASIAGMQRALDGLKGVKGVPTVPEMILVDGNKFKKYKNIPHHCIVGGDGKIASIAAASILAKTHRDEFMRKIAKEFPMYGWDRNMAYPTAEHRKAIEKYGTTKYHRLSYKLLPDNDRLFF